MIFSVATDFEDFCACLHWSGIVLPVQILRWSATGDARGGSGAQRGVWCLVRNRASMAHSCHAKPQRPVSSRVRVSHVPSLSRNASVHGVHQASRPDPRPVPQPGPPSPAPPPRAVAPHLTVSDSVRRVSDSCLSGRAGSGGISLSTC
jgi:hypothetical protein